MKKFLISLFLLGMLFSVKPGLHSQTSSERGDPSVQSAPASESPKETQAEDETAQFKHSASVRLLAKVTGLSLEHAYWLAVILNFAIVAGLIFWFSKKSLPGMFRNRTASIQESLKEARRASEDANRRLSEIESRLGNLDRDIAEMRATSEKEAAVEEERSRAAAEEEGRRIVESAEQEIAAAAKAARRELKSYAADLAVSLAAKQIQVDSSTDQSLIRKFSQQLSADGGSAKNN